MTDKEKIERITRHLSVLHLSDMTEEEFYEELLECSINDLKEEMWKLYCFAGDVCDTLNL